LNEHLRRVHTDASAQEADVTEDEEDAKPGQKRKRATARHSDNDIREELKRLRAENEELRRQSDLHSVQAEGMMRQIQQVCSRFPLNGLH